MSLWLLPSGWTPQKEEDVVNEAVEQIAYADRILLNKTDLVSCSTPPWQYSSACMQRSCAGAMGFVLQSCMPSLTNLILSSYALLPMPPGSPSQPFPASQHNPQVKPTELGALETRLRTINKMAEIKRTLRSEVGPDWGSSRAGAWGSAG